MAATGPNRERAPASGKVSVGAPPDDIEQGRMGGCICRRYETSRPLVERPTLQVGQRATCRLTQRHARCKMHAVPHVAIGHVGGSLTRSDPGERDGARHDPRLETVHEVRVRGKPRSSKARCVRKRGIDIEIDETRATARDERHILAAGPPHCAVGICPEHRTLEGVGDGGGCKPSLVAEGDVDGDEPCHDCVIEGAAEGINQPSPARVRPTAMPRFLAQKPVFRPLLAKHGENGLLRFEVGGGGKVAVALVDSLQRGPEPAKHDGCPGLDRRDRNIDVFHPSEDISSPQPREARQRCRSGSTLRSLRKSLALLSPISFTDPGQIRAWKGLDWDLFRAMDHRAQRIPATGGVPYV